MEGAQESEKVKYNRKENEMSNLKVVGEDDLEKEAKHLGAKLYTELIEEKPGEQRIPERVAGNILEMVLFFLTRAGPNVAYTEGKAKLTMSLTLEEHPKKGLLLSLQGEITLSAGESTWNARHIENDQIVIDFEADGPGE